jgi:hypothetical protein
MNSRPIPCDQRDLPWGDVGGGPFRDCRMVRHFGSLPTCPAGQEIDAPMRKRRVSALLSAWLPCWPDPSQDVRQTVTAIFPRACPPPTRPTASGVSLSG